MRGVGYFTVTLGYYNKVFRYDESIPLLYYLPHHHTLFLHLFSPLLNLRIAPITQSNRLQYYMSICEKDDCREEQRMDVKSVLIFSVMSS